MIGNLSPNARDSRWAIYDLTDRAYPDPLEHSECGAMKSLVQLIWRLAISPLAGAIVGMVMFQAAPANALEPPTGPVILTIQGKITNTNGPGAARFDREGLLALGREVLETTTHFTKGSQRFEGVRLGKVLEAVSARGKSIIVKALDGYIVEIPFEDVDRFKVFLAMKWNNKVMRVRNKGPIWIIYPISQFPETNNEIYSARSVWQLVSMTVK